MKSITLTGSKIAASITSLRITVQLFGGGCRIIKLDSCDDPQEWHINSIANSPVRITSIVEGTLVWAETSFRVAFMFAWLKKWHAGKLIKEINLVLRHKFRRQPLFNSFLVGPHRVLPACFDSQRLPSHLREHEIWHTGVLSYTIEAEKSSTFFAVFYLTNGIHIHILKSPNSSRAGREIIGKLWKMEACTCTTIKKKGCREAHGPQW